MRTLFVATPESELRGRIEKYANSLGPNLDFVGIIDSTESGFAESRVGRVDVLAIAPQNIYETLRRNERPTFQVYHNDINPLEGHYIRSGRVAFLPGSVCGDPFSNCLAATADSLEVVVCESVIN